MKKVTIIPAVAALAAFFMALPSTGADVTVAIVGEPGAWRFEPATVELQPGQRILFRNDSGETHAADCAGCPWTSGDVQPAGDAFVPFAEEAGYRFACRYHPDMTGTVQVGGADVPAEPTPDPAAIPTQFG